MSKIERKCLSITQLSSRLIAVWLAVVLALSLVPGTVWALPRDEIDGTPEESQVWADGGASLPAEDINIDSVYGCFDENIAVADISSAISDISAVISGAATVMPAQPVAGAAALQQSVTGIAAPTQLGVTPLTDDISVTVAVEKFTVDGCYIVEPTRMTLPAGSSAAYALDALLRQTYPGVNRPYRNTGSLTNNFYLSYVWDPTYTGEAGYAGYLGEFDCGETSGWMITVDNYFIGSSSTYAILHDGSVVRWQYTCEGLGTDIGGGWGQSAQFANRDALTAYVAGIRAEGSQADYGQAYLNAMAVLKDLSVNQATVDAALALLDPNIGSGDADGLKVELASAIAEASALDSSLYTQLSWAILTLQLEAAQAALDDIQAGTAQLSEALVDLRAAQSNLVLKEPTDPGSTIPEPVNPGVSIDYQTAMNGALAYLLIAVPEPEVGSVAGEWTVISLARAGAKVPDGYYQSYLGHVQDFINENADSQGRLHNRKSTENERVILALSSLGIDATEFADTDLVAPLAGSMSWVSWQGVNGSAFALIALDTKPYLENNSSIRQTLVAELLSKELSGGGWSLTNVGSAEPDMTAMVIQALAPYRNNPAVADAINRGLQRLSVIQQSDGSFATTFLSGGSESCAQLIVALSALDIDAATDTRFIKNGNNPLTAMLVYRDAETGGFRHLLDGSVDGMATDQAAYALVAYHRFKTGQTRLYDMSDVDFGGEPIVIINAATPEILTDLPATEVKYSQNQTAQPLSLVATSPDNGSLYYQWYRSSSGNPATGTAIDGAVNPVFIPPTAVVGSIYYYVVVSNVNTSVNGYQVATKTSTVVKVTVLSAAMAPDDNGDIRAARVLVEGAFAGAYAYQVDAGSESAALGLVSVMLDKLALNGVSAEVVALDYLAAQAGTAENKPGTNGRFCFNVTLDKGSGTRQSTTVLALLIVATPYNTSTDGGSASRGGSTTAAVKKELLKSAIEQVEKLTASDYTPESWLKLSNSLETAKSVAATGSASQAEVDSARKDLLASMSALVPVVKDGSGANSGSGGTSAPPSAGGPGGNQVSTGSGNRAPAATVTLFGIPWWGLLIALVLVAALAATLIVARKPKQPIEEPV